MYKKILTCLFACSLLFCQASHAQSLEAAWQQQSAEHEALCYQTYQLAAGRAKELANQFSRDPYGRLGISHHGSNILPLAIIMDLDETVIDNSGFQCYTAKTGSPYNEEVWNSWCYFQAQHPRPEYLIPGAFEFITEAEELGFTVFYLSNRSAEVFEDTYQLLKGLGLNTKNLHSRILLRRHGQEEMKHKNHIARTLGIEAGTPEAEWLYHGEGHKQSRRLEISLSYLPVFYFGDQISDFAPFIPSKRDLEPSLKLSEERVHWIRTAKEHLGKDWFILPNPTYGYWAPGRALPGDHQKYLEDYGFEEFFRSSWPEEFDQ